MWFLRAFVVSVLKCRRLRSQSKDVCQRQGKTGVSLADFISTNPHQEPIQPRSWIHLLGEAAESFLAEAGSLQPHLRGLTMRGFRRYKHQLWGAEEEHPALFGLTNLNTVLQLIEDMEDKVSFLRLVAQGLKNATDRNVVIRYRVAKSEHVPTARESLFGYSPDHRNLDEDSDTDLGLPSNWVWEYATAIRKGPNRRTKKRKHTDLSGHIRWTDQDDHVAESGEEYSRILIPAKVLTSRSFRWDASSSQDRTFLPGAAWVCVLGNPGDAAIFKRSHVELSGSEEIGHEYIDEALRCGWMNRNKLVELIDLRGGFAHPRPPQYLRCLRAFAAAAEAYKLMPGATVSTEVFSVPFGDALWIPTNQKGQLADAPQASEVKPDTMKSLMYGSSVDPRLLSRTVTEDSKRSESPLRESTEDLVSYSLSRTQVFSCIAMFENRRVNLDPRTLEQVMAISAGGSIYVAMPLICDPFDSVQTDEMKHIVGNISKPGISLLIPPMAPKLRSVDEDTWKLVNHAEFDGQLDDSFQRTSLHLSFTGYKLPMMAAEHGYQGVEANFVETLVSVFDGHERMADLDVLKALAMPSVSRLSLSMGTCRHKKANSMPSFPLTSIDSWDEFIDQPSNACIFRASGYWVARLSAAVVNAQQNLDTIILEDGKRICWKCVERTANVQGEDAQKRLLFMA